MRVLLVGAEGQLGRALQNALAYMDEVELTCWTYLDHDITRPGIVAEAAALRPDVLINAAAWTDVDAAEANPAAAFAVNMLGPLYLAEACAACGSAMLQISTNEVFPGDPGRTYFEYDLPHAQSVYARSKLAGETAVSRTLARAYVVRIAWLFGAGGNHFPRKIVAAADRHGALRVVSDEVGNPTYAPDAAAAMAALITTQRYGVYHLVNEGRASRYELALKTLELTGRRHIALTPIGSDEWRRAAPAPRHAVLVNLAGAQIGIRLRPWEEALAAYLAEDNSLAFAPA